MQIRKKTLAYAMNIIKYDNRIMYMYISVRQVCKVVLKMQWGSVEVKRTNSPWAKLLKEPNRVEFGWDWNYKVVTLGNKFPAGKVSKETC